MKHTATLKYADTQVEGSNMIIFIEYSDGRIDSHRFPAADGKKFILEQVRKIAKTRLRELNFAENLKETLIKITEETIQ